ncbi:MAG: ABC transporter ATP-binding protein [Anaerolineae bacterium]|nr:ABC transporter ATP-binding protein [Anaerolineae bacterium]
MSSTAISFNHVYKAYQANNQNGLEVSALQDVSFSIKNQEFICIVGPSGCGKSTLLMLVAELMEPSSGEIIFAQQPVGSQPRSAMVFQEQGLFPWMTVLDNIAFGLEMQGEKPAERAQRAEHFIQKVGLEGFADAYPHQLSGGMRQRVALARAFLADPQILLMDEPFGALDAQTRLILQEELLTIWGENQKMVLFVTHDIDEAILLGDRVLVMSGRPGQIMEQIDIPLERPRDLQLRNHHSLIEIRDQIWKMLEEEVRSGLNRSK